MHEQLGDWNDLNTLTATNKQLLLDSQPDPLEALRKQRSVTKNRFGILFFLLTKLLSTRFIYV